MRYYFVVNGEKVYFSFSYAGLRDAQKYLLDRGIKKRKLRIEKV